MSATADTALFARLLATDGVPAPVVESAGRTFPVDVRWLPRGARRPPRAGGRLGRAAGAAATRPATCSCSCPASARSPAIAEHARRRRARRRRPPPGRRAGPRGAGPGAGAVAAGPAPRRAGDRHRRDVADRRRRPRRRRQRPGPRPALRRGHRDDPADDGLDQPRLGRPARRPGRAHRARRRLPAVEPDGARHPPGPPGGRDHPGRPGRARARAGGVGHAAGAAGVRRPAAAQGPGARRTSCCTTLGALDGGGAITPLGRAMVGLPVHPRLARMVAGRPDALSCVVAAVVDERDVLRGRRDRLPADLALRVALVCGQVARRPGRPPGRRPGARAGRRHRPAGRRPLRRRRRRPRRRRGGAARRVPRPPRRRAAGRASSSCATAPGRGSPTTTRWRRCRSSSPPTSTASGRARASASAPPSTPAEIAALLDGVIEDRRLEWDADARRPRRARRAAPRRAAPRRGSARPAAGRGDDRGARRAGAGHPAGRAAVDAGDDPAAGTRGVPAVDDRRRVAGRVRRGAAGDARRVAGAVPRRRHRAGRPRPARPRRSCCGRMLPWPLGAELDELAPPTWTLPTGREAPIDYERRAADRVGAGAGRVRRDRRTRRSPAAGCR